MVDFLFFFSFFLSTINIGRFITTYSAILLILIAFIEAQINFCFLSRSQTKYKKEKYARKSRRPQQFIDNDQTADLEYVIPKVSAHRTTNILNESVSYFTFFVLVSSLFFFSVRTENRNQWKSKTINGYNCTGLCKIVGF